MNDTPSPFEEFCGGKLWDSNLTWYTNRPTFTQCFQDSVLTWGSCAFLWLICLIYLPYLCTVHDIPRRVNKLNTAKTIICVLLAVTAIVELIVAATEDEVPIVRYVTPAVSAGTMFWAATLIQLERSKGFITSGVMFIFWLLQTIAGTVLLYAKIIDAQDKGGVEDALRFTLFCIFFIMVLIQLVLSCIVDDPPLASDKNKNPSPETQSSFPSRITFWWLNTLVYTGYKKSLEESDLWELHPRDLSKNNSPYFDKAWADEMKSCKWNTTPTQPAWQQGNYRSVSYSSSRKISQVAPIPGQDEASPLLNGDKVTYDVEFETGKKKKVPTATLR